MRISVLCLIGLLAASLCWAADYTIGEGDGLSISVWGVPELSVKVVVRPDGKITLPAAGDLQAAGHTPAALGQHLEKVLSKYIKTPIVTVSVADITNNRVYVSGGGVTSQVVSLPGPTTLFKFLCTLSGIENADLHKSFLLRGKQRVAEDFYNLFYHGDFSKDVDLKAGDILFIPSNEQNKIYVTGAVKEPKLIIYRDGITIMDAVLEAGGLNEYAKGNSVLLVHKNGKKLKVRLEDLMEGQGSNQDVLLQPGDQVVVSEGIF